MPLTIEQHDQQVQLITNLIDARITLAGYVVQIGASSWAIHGTMPVDGNVLVAEFDSWEDASAILVEIAPPPAAAPSRRPAAT